MKMMPTGVLLVAGAAAAIGAIVLSLDGSVGPDSFALPDPDLSEAETQVATKIARLRQAVLNDPASPGDWSRLARTYHAHRLFSPAAEIYEHAIGLAPDDYRWAYLAALARRQFDLTSALPYFERAERLAPINVAFYINYADVLLQLDQIDEARARYLRAREIDERATHALYGLAQLALINGDIDEAVGHLEQAAGIAWHHGEVHRLLAQLYHRLGDTEKAAAEERLASYYNVPTRPNDPVVEAMEAEAVDAESYAVRGVRLAGRRQFKEAEYQFRKVLEYRSGRARDYANLGAALTRLGRFDEAVAYYDEALAIDADHVDTLKNFGIALSRQGELERAEAFFIRAADKDRNDADAWHNLGLVRMRQGRSEEAVQAYRQALEHNPVHAEALNNLGRALYDRGRHEEAMTQWRLAVQINPANLPAVLNLSTALVIRANHADAIQVLRAAYQLVPDSRDLNYRLGWELATAPDPSLRDPAAALNLARGLFEQAPSEARYADLTAIGFAGIGNYEQAVKLAERGVQQAERAGDAQLARQIRHREKLFRARRPFVQPRRKTTPTPRP